MLSLQQNYIIMVKQDVKMPQSKVFVKYSVTQVQFSGAASLMSDVVTLADGLVTREVDTAYRYLSLLTFSSFRMGAFSRVGA